MGLHGGPQNPAQKHPQHRRTPLRTRLGGGHALCPPQPQSAHFQAWSSRLCREQGGSCGRGLDMRGHGVRPLRPRLLRGGREFFRRVRSSYYVISGAEPGEGAEPGQGAVLRSILDALLEGKARWPGRAQVTVIPTFNSPVIQEWYRETRERQEGLDITVLGCNSTVTMQDEVFPACKLEF